ncbi:unnamed protein product [Ceutorhynchus assimilis]|uniref:DNA repair protein REV1 n=1 Tax=Ceutorhynchus assimilis TaxID=467358 RepID=A0A9N9MNR6_9CUCU|nr:unnamed protein product [Ceutorhynchus assimilis]
MCGRGSNTRFKDKKGKDIDDGFDHWGGYMAAKRAKLLDQFHSDNIVKLSDIFSGVRILVNGLTHPTAAELKNLMATHGGEFHMYQTSNTTHIIASNLPNVKIKHLGAVPVVKPAWITESIALNKLLDYSRYLLYTNQSRLQPALNFPVISNQKFETASEFLEKTKTSTETTFSTATKTASDPKFLEEFYSNSRLHLIATLGAEFKLLVGQLRDKSDGKFPGREKLIVEKGKLPSTVPQSIIMHIDMDCFFVSVGLRKHPELKGKPVAITHARSGVINSNDPSKQAARDQEFALYQERLPEGKTSRVVDITQKIDGLASMSEIASCSYEARKYGLKNGMFLGQAIKLCPELKTLPYDFEGYKEVSNTLYNTVASYTLDIEAVSCDEMYVDVKQILLDTGLSVDEWATHIRNEIMEVTGCPCSTGFGSNRLQARLATRKAKPGGQYYLEPQNVESYMSEIPLADLPGVGSATLAKLRNLAYNMCGELQSGSLKSLQLELGNKLGERIWDQAHGNDNKPLDYHHERKSISAEINYGIRFKTKEECYNFIQSLSNEVSNRLSDINMKARGLTLKLLVRAEGAPVETAKFLGHGVCDVINKSSPNNIFFSNADIIYREAKAVYDKLNVPFAELRGVGIHLSKLEKNAPINNPLSDFLKQGVVKKVKPNLDVEESPIKSLESSTSKVGASSGTKSSSVKSMNVKSRGKATRGKRGKGPGTSRIMHTFLERSKSDNGGQGEEATLFKLRSQIDMDVLKELPEDIRREVMKEYRFDINPPVDLEKSQKPDVAKPKNMGNLSETSQRTKYSPFANQTWEQIKEGIKIWIKSETDPSNVDVEMLADHLRQLALDRRIEILQSCFNFLHRNFSKLSCSWHQAYFSLVDAVQQGMVARYGKVLHLEREFFCCHIH